MPQLIRPLSVLFLVSSLLIETTLAQNCALPALVNLAEDSSRTECAPEGTILAELTTKNILSLTEVKKNVLLPDYLDIILLQDKLILKVKTPLCVKREALNSSESDRHVTYVDSTWNVNVEIEAEFLCMDGRPKQVKFLIPLIDENTQAPEFEHPLYGLVTEPCTVGTHFGYCPLNFEVPIYVTDRDRDEENAWSYFYTDKGDLIQVSGGTLESNSADIQLDRSLTSHRESVYLYLREQQDFQIGDMISFQLTAYNIRNSPTGKKLSAQTNITVTFGFGVPPEECIDLKRPTFLSSVFHATVTNNYESVQGKLLERIKPSGISAAFEPSVRRSGYGGSEEETESPLQIRYAMKGRGVFEIDSVKGSVYFIADIDASLWGTIETFEVVAYVESYDFLNVTVPLVVFFEDAPTVTCPSPSLPTVEPPTTCSDCYSTCPPLNTSCPTSPTTPATTPEYLTEGPSDPEMTTEDSGHPTQWPTETTTTESVTEPPSTTDIPASTETSTLSSHPSSTTTSPTATTPTNTPTTQATITPTTPETSSSTDLRPTTEPTDIPTTEPTGTPTTEPTYIPTTEPTDIPTTEPTGTPTTEPTYIPTTEPTDIPTTEPTGTPTTEPTGTPTTEPTDIPTTEPTDISTTEPTGTPTTEPTGTPTTEPTYIPTTEPTDIPTTEPTDISTTEPTGTPTTPEPGASTTPAPIFSTKPTTTTPTTTTQVSTSTKLTTTPVATTTTLSTTTPDPGCCDQCWKSKFECPADTSDADKKYPDPLNCSLYHQCLPNGIGGTYIVSNHCPDSLNFCKESQKCDYSYNCECGETEVDQEGCENIDCFRDCNACFNSTHAENQCKEEGLFPDKVYADIFHNCRRSDDWDPAQGFIDCPVRCPDGTVFCSDLDGGVCGWEWAEACRTSKPKSRCSDCRIQASKVRAFLQLIKDHFGTNTNQSD